MAACPFASVMADAGDKVASPDALVPESANCTSAPEMGRPPASLTTAITVAGYDALMVLLLNDNTTVPDTLEDTSVEPVDPPLLLPLEPLPNAALPDTLYAGPLELPPPPPQATMSTEVTPHRIWFFQFIAITHHFRFGRAAWLPPASAWPTHLRSDVK